MGRYTVRAGPEFDARVDADLECIVERIRSMPESDAFEAIVLIGGYARGEGTPFLREGRRVPYNDYDLVVVGGEMSRRRRRALQGRLTAVEKELTGTVGLPVDLYLHSLESLRRAEFSLLNYEMANGHMVLAGDSDILAALPDYTTRDLPLAEGTRLLLNRGELLLQIRRRLETGGELSDEERERFFKFLMKVALAWGDCIFIATREYQVSYIMKRSLIEQILPAEVPAPADIVRLYREAIEFKEGGDLALFEGRTVVDMYPEIQDLFLRFYRWFEGRRLGIGVADWRDYVARLPSLRRYSWAKCLLINILHLKFGALRPSPRWLLTYPRTRLYGALPLLLADEAPDLLEALLGSPDVRGRFFELWRRFS